MRIIAFLMACLLLVPTAARAGDGRDILGTILQGIAGEIDRQQQRKSDKRTQRLIGQHLPRCGSGDIPSCDLLLGLPNLNPEGRAALWQLREGLVVQQKAAFDAYSRNWQECARVRDPAPCDAALTYTNMSDGDRKVILTWRAQAKQHQEQAAREREAARQAALWAQRVANEREVEAARPVPQIQSTAATQTRSSYGNDKGTGVPLLYLPLIGGVLLLVMMVFGNRSKTQSVAAQSQPPSSSNLAVGQPAEASAPDGTFSLPPLTGHFPTDIRNALGS